MSKPLTIEIPHALGREEAKRRIDAGFGKLEHQFGGGGFGKLEKSWSGDRLSFQAQVLGQALSGRLEVCSEVVQMELDLPPLLAMIAGSLKGRLQKEGQLLLEKK
ncbi:MAG TPA: polyhydroxyalkanoic acid system family protein [Caulobacteraceae bacterium]